MGSQASAIGCVEGCKLLTLCVGQRGQTCGGLTGYFTASGAKGRLETGTVVTWDFHDFPGAFPVEVTEVVKNEKVILHWDGEGDLRTKVTMTFSGLDDGRTLIRIKEEGWPNDEGGLKSAFGNCEGWTQMLCAFKVYVEHGINLREGFYK